MNELDETMLMIKSIDRTAHVEFSEWTLKWFVSSCISIGDGTTLTGVNEHHDTPAKAVRMFFGTIRNVGGDEHLSVVHRGERRNYRWNGAAFTEVPSP